jgi:hypothetical protein
MNEDRIIAFRWLEKDEYDKMVKIGFKGGPGIIVVMVSRIGTRRKDNQRMAHLEEFIIAGGQSIPKDKCYICGNENISTGIENEMSEEILMLCEDCFHWIFDSELAEDLIRGYPYRSPNFVSFNVKQVV